jgi:hypothetical protein
MKLSHDLNEFVACCVAHDVRFLVVGGYAVAAHGHPRLTKDLDVWIWLGPGNAERLLAALDDFGFGEVGLTTEDLSAPGVVIQLGYPPNRIDLLTSIDGVEFEDCYPQRISLTLSGVPVPFIDRDSLIANKRASGRLQDLADVEALLQPHSD